MRSHCNEKSECPDSPQIEKARAQPQRPSAANLKKKKFFNVSVYAKAIDPPDVDLGLQLAASKLKLTSQGMKLN